MREATKQNPPTSRHTYRRKRVNYQLLRKIFLGYTSHCEWARQAQGPASWHRVCDGTATVKVEVRGVKGQKCVDLTKGFVEMLGGQIVECVHTDEFHEAEQQDSQDDRLEQRG